MLSPRIALSAAILSLALASPATAAAPTATLSSDGAWSYFTDPRAINHHGKHRRTYVGWIDSRGQIVVSSYDHRRDVRTRTVVRTGERVDDHNNPALIVRPDGRLLVFYSTKARRNLVYRLSRRPEDIRSWRREYRVPTNLAGRRGYTYPSPVWLKRERRPLFLFWRGGSFEPVFSTSRDGTSWSRAQKLVEGNGHRPYLVFEPNGRDRVHVAFSEGNPNELATSIYYMAYRAGRLEGAGGNTIAPLAAAPIQPSEADVIYQGGGSRPPAWAYDVGMGDDGRPVVTYATFPSPEDHRYHYARWTGTRWLSYEMTASGPTIEKAKGDDYYAGGMVLDSRDSSVVYLSRQVAGVYQVERWRTTDGGATWTSRPVTSGNDGSYRPVSARGPSFGDHHDLFWMTGRYAGWLDFGTSIETRVRRGARRMPDASFDVVRAATRSSRRVRFRGVRAAAREWNFGDGTRRVGGRRVGHTYKRPGRYRVSSTARNRAAKRDVFVREIRVRARAR